MQKKTNKTDLHRQYSSICIKFFEKGRGERLFFKKVFSRIKKGYIMHDELTEVDIQKMKEEIEYRMQLNPKLRDEVRRTRELGDLSENDEYRSARREWNRNNSRINYLKAMIETAIVIKVDHAEDTVGLFDKVTLWYEEDEEESTITLVTTLRNDVLNGYVSKESPLGTAIMGKKKGDRVFVKVNENYSYPVVIRQIEKGVDDPSLKIQQH